MTSFEMSINGKNTTKCKTVLVCIGNAASILQNCHFSLYKREERTTVAGQRSKWQPFSFSALSTNDFEDIEMPNYPSLLPFTTDHLDLTSL